MPPEEPVDPEELLRGFVEHAIADADRFLASGDGTPWPWPTWPI
jgi:hypothetical protein